MLKIRLLDKKLEQDYENYLSGIAHAQLFQSVKYRNLLEAVCRGEPYYFIAFDENNRIAGVLPSFLKSNHRYGNILNSLPFYGSHGSVISHTYNQDVYCKLLSAFYSFANENNCVSATLISPLLEQNDDFYLNNAQYDYIEKRIGQFKRLPLEGTGLMPSFHVKTRNAIRKAQKNSIRVEKDNKRNYLDFLIAAHSENIREKGGIVKPSAFFDLLPKVFEYKDDYRVYTAFLQGAPVAALLLFYYNNIVEYFTPVNLKEYRSLQPLSLIIFEAMQDAVAQGYKIWNWGGTWVKQEGVYDFKKKWGSAETTYHYYTKIYDDSILDLTKEKIADEYPYWFVVPFERLR